MRFRIGQRVRIVSADFHQSHVGREATAVSALAMHDGWPQCETYEIEIDGIPSPLGYDSWLAAPCNLAPATDCYDKADWRECVWQPPHMRETA